MFCTDLAWVQHMYTPLHALQSLLDLASPAVVQGVLLRFHCDVLICMMLATYSQSDGGFSSGTFTACVLLLQLLKRSPAYIIYM
jgi:hypothetical protein